MNLTRTIGDLEPIAALATPEGVGGIAVVRASGRGCWRALERLAVEPIALGARQPIAARLRYDPERASLPALLLPFAAGASYTAEECVEIYLPSSPPLLRALLEALRRAGVRGAEPGEFTRRAFLHGRIDLTRAESVAQLIAAEDRASAEIARRVLEGGLARGIRAIGDRVHELIALLEAGLDFSEQEVEGPAAGHLESDIAAIESEVAALIAAPAARTRELPRVRLLVWGRANAGKSTLFNRLAGGDFAITSPAPGTTRDPVSARVAFSGLPPVELLDLAGEMPAFSAPEQGAARLARALLAEGDTVLYLLDGARARAELEAEWSGLAPEIRNRAWPILSKVDLIPAERAPDIAALMRCSALTGRGVDDLRHRIAQHVRGGAFAPRGERFLMTERQLGKLRDFARELARAREALRVDDAVHAELLVIDLRRAHALLEEITGEVATEDTLELIFRRFCLGK